MLHSNHYNIGYHLIGVRHLLTFVISFFVGQLEVRVMVLNSTFNNIISFCYIVTVSFIGGGNRTLTSLCVLSSTTRHEQDSNSQREW